MVKRVIIDREQYLGQCFLRKHPKGEVLIIDELMEREKTHQVKCPQRDSPPEADAPSAQNSCSRLEKNVGIKKMLNSKQNQQYFA